MSRLLFLIVMVLPLLSMAAEVGDSIADLRLHGVGEPTVEMRHHVGEYRRAGVYYPEDEIRQEEAPDSNRYWWHLLQRNRLSLQDTTVRWPRFLGACIGLYRWGDRFFNGFDTTYVVGTGRRWKVRLVTDLWADSYLLKFSGSKPIAMTSQPIVHTGLYLQYMAVSVGYQIDVGNVIFNRPTNNRKLNFGFSCGLFSFDGTYTENTGSELHRFESYNDGHAIKQNFPGLSMNSLEADIYFFWNHRRYSQVAAYSFGRLQKKRAGSLMLGFSYLGQNIKMDFNTLPPEMVAHISPENRQIRFNYHNYNLIVGYGYNWPVGRHLLFNLTALPTIGFNSSGDDARQHITKMVSLGLRGLTSVTLNYGDCFCGVSGRMTGQLYYSRGSSLFSFIESANVTFGVRF